MGSVYWLDLIDQTNQMRAHWADRLSFQSVTFGWTNTMTSSSWHTHTHTHTHTIRNSWRGASPLFLPELHSIPWRHQAAMLGDKPQLFTEQHVSLVSKGHMTRRSLNGRSRQAPATRVFSTPWQLWVCYMWVYVAWYWITSAAWDNCNFLLSALNLFPRMKTKNRCSSNRETYFSPLFTQTAHTHTQNITH